MSIAKTKVTALDSVHHQNYSSKDFGKVGGELVVNVPDRLIHSKVTAGEVDQSFSSERKHPVHVVDLPSTALSMTLGGLYAGQCSGKHRHTYETIIYILKGVGHSIIQGKTVNWETGDAIYVPQWAWHQHFNDSEDYCEYLGCENAPMLQRLGLALREEAEH